MSKKKRGDGVDKSLMDLADNWDKPKKPAPPRPKAPAPKPKRR